MSEEAVAIAERYLAANRVSHGPLSLLTGVNGRGGRAETQSHERNRPLLLSLS